MQKFKIVQKIKKLYSFLVRENRLLVVALLFLFVFSVTLKAFATYPTTPFFPSEQENDPSCSPGDANCYVTPLAIGEAIGDGDDNSILFIDTNGDLAEDSTNFYFDDATDTLYTDGVTLANNLEITTTTGSTVGVITKDGTRFLHTYKPAGTNDNLFLGKGAGNFTLSATSNFNANVGIGENSLATLSTGYFNTALGTAALRYTTTGNNNTAVGLQAGNRISTGTYNVAVGMNALYGAGSPSSASGSHNVALGYAPLYALSTGSNNVAIGYQSGFNSSSAADNIFIGYEAGHDITTESGNIFIGYQAGADATGSNQLYIENTNSASPLIFGDFANDEVVINGLLGVGSSNTDGFNVHIEEDARVELVGTGYGGSKTLFAMRYANGTKAVPSAVTVGQIMGELAIGGYKDTVFSTSAVAYIRGVSTETFTDSATGSKLEFGTTPNTTTGTATAMTLDQSGYLGIGDTSPDELLNISSTTSNGIAISSIGADVDPYLKFELVDGTASFTMGVDDSDSDSFKISTTALGTSDRFIIDSSGNINVGGDGTPGSLFSVGSTSQFQVGSSGSIDAVTSILTSGAVTIGSAGTGALNVGTTSGVYRTTNASGNVTPQTVFDVDNSNSTAGFQAYMFDTTNGFVFTGANGTRRIARASIDITNLTNTANSETGDLAFSTKPSGAAITERLRIDASGEVGIGDTTPDYLLDVENTAVDTDIFALTDSDGACLHNPEAGSEVVTCSSDERLKENIVDGDEILPYLDAFRIREYDVRASGDHMYGVVAQEVMLTHPELVRMGSSGFYTVEIPSTWEVIKAIQELNLSVTDLTSFELENENSLANRLMQWLADATNGIQNIFAKRVTVEELCVEDVCITKEDLLNILDENTEYNPPADDGSDEVVDPDPVDEDTGGDGEEVVPETDGEELPPVNEDPIEEGDGETGGGNTDPGDGGGEEPPLPDGEAI